jgi:hypothetical protein
MLQTKGRRSYKKSCHYRSDEAACRVGDTMAKLHEDCSSLLDAGCWVSVDRIALRVGEAG